MRLGTGGRGHEDHRDGLGRSRGDRRVPRGRHRVRAFAERRRRAAPPVRRPGRSDRAAIDVDRRRPATRSLPDELPLLRAVRRARCPRARGLLPPDVRCVLGGGLLRNVDDAVPAAGRADVPAPERVEPGRLLQRRPLRPSGPSPSCGGVDVGRHGAISPGVDVRRRRGRDPRRLRPGGGPRDHPAAPRSSGRTAGRSSTTRPLPPASRSTRRPSPRCNGSSTCDRPMA